jgi:hypothetical protein
LDNNWEEIKNKNDQPRRSKLQFNALIFHKVEFKIKTVQEANQLKAKCRKLFADLD